jgi:tRNA 5-methylaminomethyl-2-thiouridine biosynthesis bifunctional protein
MPQFDRGGGAHAEWRLAAYLAATRLYEGLGALNVCGAEETVRDPAAFADLCADPPLPEDWLAARDGRLLHRRAGIVHPADLVAALTRGIPRRAVRIARIERTCDRWRLIDPAGVEIDAAEAVALCCGARLAAFAQTAWLPLRLSRGQLEWAPAPAPDVARAGASYAAPAADGVVFGATFDKCDAPDAPVPDEASRRRNLAALARLAPEIAVRLDGERVVSHAALRAALPDYAPVVGLLPDALAWRALYAGLAHGRPIDASRPPPALPGLYAFGGLSARGFTLAPLLAERLAAEINGEPAPLSRAALDALHPARFLKRALKRNEWSLIAC